MMAQQVVYATSKHSKDKQDERIFLEGLQHLQPSPEVMLRRHLARAREATKIHEGVTSGLAPS